MEAGGLFQWELAGLCCEAADVLIPSAIVSSGWLVTYMIIIKQQHEQKPKRESRKYPFHLQLPEVD